MGGTLRGLCSGLVSRPLTPCCLDSSGARGGAASTVERCFSSLLEAGVAIYEYQPTMYHVKVAIVDEIWTSVGSTNFDNRSFRLNDEANLNVFDIRFAEEQAGVFEEDKRRARRITLEEWRRRPWRERAIERLAALLRLQL